MREGRLVMIAFGTAAAIMIAMPIATVWTMTRPGPADQGLDGAISKAFLSAERGADPSARTWTNVPAVPPLLPKGMAETTVFRTLAASGFTCATDSDAATCFRTSGGRCRGDWKVRLIFRDDGTVWSTNAERMTTCL